MSPDAAALTGAQLVDAFDQLFAGRRDVYAEGYADPGERVVVGGQPSTGKALAHGEPVLTPTGWTPVEELQVGDAVIAGDGSVTRVCGVFPQGERDLFRVSLGDGSSVVVDGDHQWLTTTRWERVRRRSGQVRTTREVAASLTYPNGGGTVALNHQLPVVGVVQHPETELPVDPYVLGCWLGNGSAGGAGITSQQDLFDQLRASGATLGFLAPNSDRSVHGVVLGLYAVLRFLKLRNCRSYERFIPVEYLHAGPQQRLALLQGLMDTDGSISGLGGVQYYTTSPDLARQVAELARSLGGVVRVTGKYGMLNGVKHRWCSVLSVSLPFDIVPFRLPRKVQRRRPQWRAWGRAIASVEPVGRGLATCIAVDHPSQLFVTRDHVVTVAQTERPVFHLGLPIKEGP